MVTYIENEGKSPEEDKPIQSNLITVKVSFNL